MRRGQTDECKGSEEAAREETGTEETDLDVAPRRPTWTAEHLFLIFP